MSGDSPDLFDEVAAAGRRRVDPRQLAAVLEDNGWTFKGGRKDEYRRLAWPDDPQRVMMVVLDRDAPEYEQFLGATLVELERAARDGDRARRVLDALEETATIPEPPRDVQVIRLLMPEGWSLLGYRYEGKWQLVGQGSGSYGLHSWASVCRNFPEARWVPLDVAPDAEPVPLTPPEEAPLGEERSVHMDAGGCTVDDDGYCDECGASHPAPEGGTS